LRSLLSAEHASRAWSEASLRAALVGEPERIVGEHGKGEVNAGGGGRINLLSTNGFIYSLLTMFVARRCSRASVMGVARGLIGVALWPY
jgi:hypothetical protein